MVPVRGLGKLSSGRILSDGGEVRLQSKSLSPQLLPVDGMRVLSGLGRCLPAAAFFLGSWLVLRCCAYYWTTHVPLRARRMKYYRGCESKKTLKKRESGKKNNEHCVSDGVNHSAKGQSELSGETRNSD